MNFFKIDAEIAFKNKVDTDLWDTLHIRHQSICILLEDIVSDRLEIIGNKYKTYIVLEKIRWKPSHHFSDSGPALPESGVHRAQRAGRPAHEHPQVCHRDG